MSVEQKLVTAADLLALPDSGARRELVRGVVREMAPAGDTHGAVAAAILVHLGRYLYDNPVAEVRAAETGFRLGGVPETVRAPDVAVIRLERIPRSGLADGYFVGAPDLAVEVVSPHDSATEVLEKVEDWLAGGAQLVWVVYPRVPRLVVHRAGGAAQTLGPDDRVDGGGVLSGFGMPLRDLLNPFRPG